MDVFSKWFSGLGFVIEIEHDSLIVSGKFAINSATRSFRGVCIDTPDKYELSFIITWETNTKTSTVFTGRLLEENSLSLDWLLFVEDHATSKINTFQGNLVLNRYPTEPKFTEVRQEKLPFPEILYDDFFPSKA